MPFAFTAAEARRGGRPDPGYASNVAPPARERVSLRTVCGRAAVGLLLVAGLVAAAVLGTPALSAPDTAPAAPPGAQPAPARGHH
ncbi:hypothetical protein [Streptomyces sp. CB03911]|uniref:hypothetical protein n=1 Tax=Streptomycetaceae TaxID=2062 RepID=UPI0025708CB6|nr:hypothetical protein [Streptomyces sp. CB03911]